MFRGAPARSRSSFLLLGVVLLVATTILVLASVAGRFFVWNLSASLPRGLYRLRRGFAPRRGAVVTLAPPDAARALIIERGYLPAGASLLKTIVAVSGDRVCITAGSFSARGAVIGAVASRDSKGRPLAPYDFCGVVPAGLAFVATTALLSFDSRYFGPVPISSLVVAVPVWTF